MPVPKPSAVPVWAPTGGNVVEPTNDQKSLGWQAGQKPPGQYVNWFWKEISNWVAWIQDLTVQGLVPVARASVQTVAGVRTIISHSHVASVSLSGSSLLVTLDYNLVPGYSVTVTSSGAFGQFYEVHAKTANSFKLDINDRLGAVNPATSTSIFDLLVIGAVA